MMVVVRSIIFLFLFIFLSGGILILAGCVKGPQGPQGPGEFDEFANCLTKKDVKMYGTDWCSHCKDQKKLFGESFLYVDYVDCDKSQAECGAAGVEGYPTWVVDGKNYPGVQSLERLAFLSGCELGK